MAFSEHDLRCYYFQEPDWGELGGGMWHGRRAPGSGGGDAAVAEPTSGSVSDSAVDLPDPAVLAPRAAADWERNQARRGLSLMLRHMRRSRGLSQTIVAERMGTTQPVVARMESATGPWPSQETIAAYAAACNHLAVLGFFDLGDAEGAAPSTVAEQRDATIALPVAGNFAFLPLGQTGPEVSVARSARALLAPGDIYELVAESDTAGTRADELVAHDECQ